VIRTPLHLLQDHLGLPKRFVIKQVLPFATYDARLYNAYLALFAANCLLFPSTNKQSFFAKTSRRSLREVYANLLWAHCGVGSEMGRLSSALREHLRKLLPGESIDPLPSAGILDGMIQKASQARYPTDETLRTRLKTTCQAMVDVLGDPVAYKIASDYDLHYGVVDLPRKYSEFYEIAREDSNNSCVMPDHKMSVVQEVLLMS
jgi:hypothetical protein